MGIPAKPSPALPKEFPGVTGKALDEAIKAEDARRADEYQKSCLQHLSEWELHGLPRNFPESHIPHRLLEVWRKKYIHEAHGPYPSGMHEDAAAGCPPERNPDLAKKPEPAKEAPKKAAAKAPKKDGA